MTTVICLTAAVTPRVAGPVTLADPAERLRQYQSSARWWATWAQQSNSKVRVIETTGCSAELYTAEVPQHLRELVDFTSIHVPPSVEARGKGAAEFYALAELLAISPELIDATIYKATGRLTIPNASRVIRALPPGHAALRMTLDRTYADTRLLGMAGATWAETLAEVVDKMDDMCGLIAEHVIAGYIASRAAVHELRVDRFPEKPLMVGISGSTGSTYRGEWKPATRLRGLIENRLAAIASRKQV